VDGQEGSGTLVVEWTARRGTEPWWWSGRPGGERNPGGGVDGQEGSGTLVVEWTARRGAAPWWWSERPGGERKPEVE